MRSSHQRHRSIAIALLVGALVLGACGSDAPGTAQSTVPPTSAADSGATTQAGETATDTAPTTDETPTTDANGNFPSVFNPPTTGDLKKVRLSVDKVASFDSPTVLAARPGTDTLYVAERKGLVRSLTIDGDKARVDREPVLDLTDDTTTQGERGLLGLAFSTNGKTLYVNHTNQDGNTRVESYAMEGDRATASSRKVLLAVDQPFANHNGGNVVFGPDGMLWVGLGDGGAGDDPGNRAQNPETPLGKMLRIDPAAPKDPEVWALGLRNPWRYSFDRDTGDLWIGDVGQNEIEEVDFLPAKTAPGTNFGWSGHEGTQLYKNEPDRVPGSSVPPVFEMNHSDGWCSVTGGVVYRGKANPALVGTYLFGDYCKSGLHGLRLAGGAVSDQQELGVEVPQLVSINEDNDGEVYLISLDGGIYRLGPP